MKKSYVIITLIFVSVSLKSLCQDYENRIVLGENYATSLVEKVSKDYKKIDVKDTLLRSKAEAVAFAEPILYKKYSKRSIRNQRPYECYLISGFWYVSGTLAKGRLGGTFEIIISAYTGEVLMIRHGQ